LESSKEAHPPPTRTLRFMIVLGSSCHSLNLAYAGALGQRRGHRHFLLPFHDVRHLRSPYAYYCTPIISAYQQVFACYSIVMFEDTPEKEAVGAKRNENHAEEGNDKTVTKAPPNMTEPSTPPPITNARAPKRKNKRGLERAKFAVEVLTLIVVACYTRIAFNQWEEMRKTTKAATKAANAAFDNAEYIRKDQRPWIFVTMPHSLDVFNLANSGGAPSIARMNCSSDYITDPVTETQLKAIEQKQNLLPEGLVTMLIERQTVATTELPTCSHAAITEKRAVNAIYGRIDYTDLGSNQRRYLSMFCFYKRVDGSITFCRDTDQTKTNYMSGDTVPYNKPN
jgi:hypothetical protein